MLGLEIAASNQSFSLSYKFYQTSVGSLHNTFPSKKQIEINNDNNIKTPSMSKCTLLFLPACIVQSSGNKYRIYYRTWTRENVKCNYPSFDGAAGDQQTADRKINSCVEHQLLIVAISITKSKLGN